MKIAGLTEIPGIKVDWDGNAVFSLSLGEAQADISILGLMAVEAVSGAVEWAFKKAETLGGIPLVGGLGA